MKIGIVIAIARELKSFLESDFKIKNINNGKREYFFTKINGNKVFAIKSGYGLIDAASATQFLIDLGCEVILNYGVTGAVDGALKVNDLFVVNKVCCHDFDTSPIDPVKKCQFEEFDDIYIPMDSALIEKAKSIKPDLKDAVVASGNKFIEKREEKDYLREELKCNICDMEIAAISRTCFVNGVKAFSIKSISDTLDGDGSDFNENVKKSGQVAFDFLKEFLLSL